MMVSVTNRKHTTTEVRKMRDQRLGQLESWYRSEKASNLDAAELANLVEEKNGESVFSKLVGLFKTI